MKLFISALTFANTHYLLLRHLSENEAGKLIKFKLLVKILPLEDKILELALASDFRDFEDAIQYHTALENKLNIIITRNKKFQNIPNSSIDCERVFEQVIYINCRYRLSVQILYPSASYKFYTLLSGRFLQILIDRLLGTHRRSITGAASRLKTFCRFSSIHTALWLSLSCILRISMISRFNDSI